MSAEVLKKLDEISRDIGELKVSTATLGERIGGVNGRLKKVEEKLDNGFGARLRRVEQKQAALSVIVSLLAGAAGILKVFKVW